MTPSFFLNPSSGSVPSQLAAWAALGFKMPTHVSTNIQTATSTLEISGDPNDNNKISDTAFIGKAFFGQSVRAIVGVPMFGKGEANALTRAMNGEFVAFWRYVATQLVYYGLIDIRLPWEFDMTSQPWSCVGRPLDFAAALRLMVGTFRAVAGGSAFRFCYCGGGSAWPPSNLFQDAYPGDDFVDVMGETIYFNERIIDKVTHIAESDQTTWNRKWSALGPRMDFAAKHNKPFMFPEVGITNDESFFATQMKKLNADMFIWNKSDGHSMDVQPKTLAAFLN